MTASDRAQEMAPTPALDRSVLQELREAMDDVSGEFVASLAEVYETQAVELMTELDEAARDADTHRVGFAAHSLKGSSANVGGNRLAALCGEVEHWDGASQELRARVATIREELSRLLAELTEFVPR